MIRRNIDTPANMDSLYKVLEERRPERRIEKLHALEDAFIVDSNIEGAGICLHEIAMVQVTMKQYQVAINTFTQGLQLYIPDATKGAFLFNRASTYDLMGLPEQAKTDYLAAKQLVDPQYYGLVELGLRTIGQNIGKPVAVISVWIGKGRKAR